MLYRKSSIIGLIILFMLGITLSANAAAVTWSGGGADGLASNPANWSGGAAPQYGDDVVFDGISAKDCTWDSDVTLTSININPGFTGIITLNSELRITGDLNIRGGVFKIIDSYNLIVGYVFAEAPPIVTTDPATDINGNAATLNATVNPNGAETTVYFEWGADTSYGNSTAPQNIGSGAGNVSVSEIISGLSVDTTYHYRVVATNANETNYGDNMSFTTTSGTIVSGQTISTDTTWTFAGSPYIITGDIYFFSSTSEPTLTIEPGVVVRFAGSELRFGIGDWYSSYETKGRLDAQGTASRPIVFTSNQPVPAPGDWVAISFYNLPTVPSILKYVLVEYGNSGIFVRNSSLEIQNSTIQKNLNYGISILADYNATPVSITDSVISMNGKDGIYSYGADSLTVIDSTISDNVDYGIYSTSGGSITVTGSTFSNNGNDGIYVADNISEFSVFSNNVFTNNGSYPLSIPAYIGVGTGNTISGNGTDGIKLRESTISTNTTWTYQSVPYIVTGEIYVTDISEPVLTIEPGVVVKFDCICGLAIGHPQSYAGRINAQGTASEPITFTSNQSTPAPGDWGGINFWYRSSAQSILDYVTVEYGGYGTNSGSLIGLYRDNDSLLIKNSTLQYSQNDGIYMQESSSVSIIGSTISNNTQKGIYSASGEDLNVTFSIISDNGDYAVYSAVSVLNLNHSDITGNGNGVYSSTGYIADVRFNWWGDVTGPSGQGPGTGQSVSSGINFEPWLGTAYTYPFYNTDFDASIQDFNPLNNSVDYTFSISEDSDWTFKIKSSGGTTVRTFTGSGTGGNVTWNGKDEGSVIVPDGTYTYQLDSTRLSDSAQSAPFVGDVIVGQNLPIAEITYPLDGQWITGNTPVVVQGTADDSSDFQNYSVEYGRGTAPTSWTLIASSTTPVNAGTLATWNTTDYTNHYYTLKLAVNDNAGNTPKSTIKLSHCSGMMTFADIVAPISMNSRLMIN